MMADIVENNASDVDTISQEELEQLFYRKYNLFTEHLVAASRPYVTAIAGNKSFRLAVGLSDQSIAVYDLNHTLSRVCRFVGHEDSIREVVFCPQNEHILYSCAEDGFVKSWDTRAGGGCVQRYMDQDNLVSTFICMDVSCNGRVLCAGSPLIAGDVYMLFWEPRMSAPLGGYWNSHYDDITQVRFHKERPEIIASGGLDGLINVFNIMEVAEDVALVHTLNVINSVERLSWLSAGRLASVAQSADVQVWNTLTGGIISEFDRDTIASNMKRSRADDCYLVDVFQSLDGAPTLLGGSYGGDGGVLRSLMMTDQQLQPCTNFTQNSQCVRCCYYDDNRDMLVTAGESGLISVWARNLSTEEGSSEQACSLQDVVQNNIS